MLRCPVSGLLAGIPLLLAVGATALPEPGAEPPEAPPPHQQARAEQVPDLRVWASRSASSSEPQPVRLERVSTAVPWPRGLAMVDGEVVVLARGRHRNAGGIDPRIADQAGSLIAIDPDVWEPVVEGVPVGDSVRANARLLARPSPGPFQLFDPREGEPIEQWGMDRPYCTLAYDALSRNFFICGYSGVDLPEARFRKNAADSIHRFDARDGRWHAVEVHEAAAVPESELGYVVSNEHYPHHDPERNAPPHGLLNGPNGACVVGSYLYATGKDNHVMAQYDLEQVRGDPMAPPPAGRVVIGSEIDLRLEGRVRRVQLLGHSAAAAHDGYLYLGYRTSSVVVRFPIDDRGDLVQPAVGELVAVFEPWSTETGRSANLIDLCFDSQGRLYVSCAEQGRIWRVGIPDPGRVFDGVDVGPRPTANRPWVDLRRMTDNPRARCGNIAFDADDRLYLCSGNYDSGTELAGVIYRAVEE